MGGGAVPPSKPELAVLLALDQKWLLKTYERGRLASSISLTPQEEVTVDVYSWDRRKTSREDTTTFDTETNADSQSVDRDTRDVFAEVTRNGNFGAGLNGSFSGYGLTVGGNLSDAATIARVARGTQQHFQEDTTKASEKVHVSRQLKITESTETGSETRVTRKLRNSNLCHAVTYHYFELVGRYVVSTGFAKRETVFVLLVDNPFARPTYDVNYVRAYESVIRRALLDPAVASGLDAARTLWMLTNAPSVICNDCPCPGDLVGTEDSTDFAQTVNAVRSLGIAVTVLRQRRLISWRLYFTSLINLPNQATGLPGIPTNQAVRQALFVDAIEQTAPGLLANLEAMCAPFAGGSATAAQLGAFSNQFAAVDAAKIEAAVTPDAELQKTLKGLLDPRIRPIYQGDAKNTVLSLIHGNKTGNDFIDGIVMRLSENLLTEDFAMGSIVNAILGAMSLSPGFGTTDANSVDQLVKTVTTMLAAWKKDAGQSAAAAAQTRQAHQSLFVSVFPPGTVLTAMERFDALVRHLGAYSDYYANSILTDLISRGQFSVPVALLPFLGFVSPNPVAVVQGKLAYAIDLSSSPSFSAAIQLLQGIVDALPDETTTGEVTLPTPGFIVEPKLSCCSACEDFVESSRTIELDLRRAQADQAKREAERRERLLGQTPPKLEPFDPGEPKLRIDLVQTTPVPGG
jgi:hypothetical protein